MVQSAAVAPLAGFPNTTTDPQEVRTPAGMVRMRLACANSLSQRCAAVSGRAAFRVTAVFLTTGAAFLATGALRVTGAFLTTGAAFRVTVVFVTAGAFRTAGFVAGFLVTTAGRTAGFLVTTVGRAEVFLGLATGRTGADSLRLGLAALFTACFLGASFFATRTRAGFEGRGSTLTVVRAGWWLAEGVTGFFVGATVGRTGCGVEVAVGVTVGLGVAVRALTLGVGAGTAMVVSVGAVRVSPRQASVQSETTGVTKLVMSLTS